MSELFQAVSILFLLLSKSEQDQICHVQTPIISGAIEKSKQSPETLCVTDAKNIEGRDTKVYGYVNGKYEELLVSDSRLLEREGGYGCLVANIKIGYCSEYVIESGHIFMGVGIGSKGSDILLRENSLGYGRYYYCDELPEKTKYDPAKKF